MVGLKNINFMSTSRFNSMGDTKEEEVYLVGDTGVAYVVESYKSGHSWYRVWSDGWIEQGGKTGILGSNTVTTVTLLKSYKEANYTITAIPHYFGGTSNSWNENQWISAQNTNNFVVYNSSSNLGGIYWQACGR